MKMKIITGDASTPLLKEVQASLKPGSKESLKLRRGMAARLETTTRDHIRMAAGSRHKTATRLSAKPTGYLSRRAETVESFVTGNPDGLIRLTVYGDIFSRVDGAVSVTPKRRAWLAIPNVSEAYARRPREIPGLRFMLIKKGKLAALVTDLEGPPAPGKRQPVKIWYWLKKGVTLPQDRGLLPTEKDYLDAVEKAADDYLAALEASQSSFGAGGRSSPA